MEARAAFKRRMKRWKPKQLIFIDETGVNLALTRSHGRCERGERLIDDVPVGRWQMYTIIAGLRADGVVAPMLLQGAMDTDALRAWVRKCLCPKLKPGDIVVWDNISFHSDEEVLDAIQARGARVEFLPPYSPELNPIEEAWSKAKAILKVAKARAVGALTEAVEAALKAIKRSDCLGWIAHAGYAT